LEKYLGDYLKKYIIAVVGHDAHAKEEHLKIAEQVGKEIAKKNCILVCGGRPRGVADSAAKGTKSENGFTIGILPESDNSKTGKYIDVPILTGMGFARNQIISYTCDAMIAIGGGVGTYCEMAYAYAFSKPIVAIEKLSGKSAELIGKYMDEKNKVKVLKAKDARQAVELAIKNIKK